MKRLLYFISFILLLSQTRAQEPVSHQLANTAMKIWPDSFLIGNDKVAKWRYDQGVILKGIEEVWKQSGQGRWYTYIEKSMNFHLLSDGNIKGYKKSDYNIDFINNGKLLLLLYQVTEKEKYKKAADILRDQLLTHPRTKEGSFWHKKIYEWQVWLDGLYMGMPFYAQYAQMFHEDTVFNDIARQFRLVQKNLPDYATGYLHHGYDESRSQQWADKTSGRSPHVWGRALGWYGMALVDVLDYFPETHSERAILIGYLQSFVKSAADMQDKKSGLWYDIPNLPGRKGNYKEASASAMMLYTFAKAARKGYIDTRYKKLALKGWTGFKKEFLKEENGQLNLHGTVSVSGLGGKPYRDGSFEYYMSEPVVVNDPKGLGAAILCAAEIEKLSVSQFAKNKKILLDRYFNSEKKKDITGREYYWHYVWNGWSHPGFGLVQQSFERLGASVHNLDAAPTTENLKDYSVYIIVDPDHKKDNPNPNYMTEEYASAIAEWVKQGGALWLMANDSANCDLQYFNLLSQKFGIEFTNKSRNMVKNDSYEQGAILLNGKDEVFGKRKVFLKEISTLSLTGPAKALVKEGDDVIISIAKYGKGVVLAVGDPWLYNEYVDGRRLPADFDNLGAAQDIAKWLLKKAKKK